MCVAAQPTVVAAQAAASATVMAGLTVLALIPFLLSLVLRVHHFRFITTVARSIREGSLRTLLAYEKPLRSVVWDGSRVAGPP
jgi:hypothetical protein